jgi:ribonuclease III
VVSDLSKLEKTIGFEFGDKKLLKEALTHRSYINENPDWSLPHNERLEYLGDAVLELVTTEFLFAHFPEHQEGQLTSLRAALVNYQMLGKVAREIDLEDFLFLSRGETKDTGKAREVILANAIEALFGAAYLDRGYEVVREMIRRTVFKHLDEILEKGLYRDSKSALQELVQDRFKVTPIYRVLKESGPDHQKNFSIGVFHGEKMMGEGNGPSKQEAESQAAEDALRGFKEK